MPSKQKVGTKRAATAPVKKAPVAKKSKSELKQQVQLESESESESESEVSESESESEDVSESEDELDNIKGDAESESEDELDNIKEDNDDEEDEKLEEREEDYSNDATEEDPNKKSSREVHIEQRQLLSERKLKRKSGVEVQRIKQLWERLRVKSPPVPKEVRDKLCDEIWELSSDVIGDLVLKHDASRVVQTLVKYCSKERREIVVKALKGHYYLLATSSYGKYLLIKLLHYGSKDSRELILNELHGKLRKLMRHREGAYVVEDLYVLYATQKQKQQMIREFWGAEYAVFRDSNDDRNIKDVCSESSEKRKLISSNLFGTIKASVEKGSTGFQILHAAMREFIQIMEENEIREFQELLDEQIAELVHTPEGCEVACTLVATATAKERKAILKNLKQHSKALVTNEHGQVVLNTIFLTVDDTVLVSKTFTNEYKEDMQDLINDKFSRRPFLYLLNGFDKHFFSPLVLKDLHKYEELSKQTSKKPQEQRRTELLKNFLPIFYNALIEHTNDSLSENIGAQFIQELLLNNEFPEDEDIKELRLKGLDSILTSIKSDLRKDDHPIKQPFTARLLKTIIQGGRWNNKDKKIEKLDSSLGLGDSFASKFIEELFENGENDEILIKWIESPGCFAIVALVDSFKENAKDKNGLKFLKTLKKLNKTVIKKEATENDNKGAQLLSKLL